MVLHIYRTRAFAPYAALCEMTEFWLFHKVTLYTCTDCVPIDWLFIDTKSMVCALFSCFAPFYFSLFHFCSLRFLRFLLMVYL